MGANINATLALLRQAQERISAGGGRGSGVALKDIATQLGYVWYDLQPVASQLFPVITPLRNRIPRVPGNGGTMTHWKAIMGINVTRVSPGVSEGHRNAPNVTAEQDFSVAYKTLGHDDFVTEQARQANGQLTPAVDALAVQDLLLSLMIDEEFVILNGNAGLALGQPVAPIVYATPVAGGSLPAQVNYVWVVALTPDGYNRVTLSGGCPGQYIRKNMDGSTDALNPGTSQVSPISAASCTTSGGNLSVSVYVTPVVGAAAYAWFIGPTAATAQLAAITTTSQTLITSVAGVAQYANDPKIAADYSQDTLVFDGIQSLMLQLNGLNAVQALSTATPPVSTALTADGMGGVVEINTDLRYFWDNWRLSPTEMIVSAQELTNITNRVIAGGSAPLFRYLMDIKGGANGIVAGALVGTYLNKVGMGGTGVEIPVRLHPQVVPGTIVYWTDKLPYPLVNVKNITQVRTRREFREIDWPIVTNRQEYGVYVDEALETRAAFAYGRRCNILNG
jgi:hypothetical protein